jgi:hypothetical protein
MAPRRALAAALALAAAGCAADRAAWRAEACTPQAVREEGGKDAAAGKPYAAAEAEVLDGCDAGQREALRGAYRVGYQEVAARTGKVALPGGRAFRCEVRPFGEPIVGTGATEREAREAAAAACAARHGERHCGDVTCRLGE